VGVPLIGRDQDLAYRAHSRIRTARRAVGDDGTRQRVIRTVHGRGYIFVAEVITA
jgi:DNA-binding winged helix-turn-helix (wHTH) protein